MKFAWLKILVPIFLITSVLLAAVPANAFDPLANACSKGGTGSGSASCTASSSQVEDPVAGPTGIIHKIANLIAVISGIGATVMIALGAFYLITSGGNADASAKARSRIMSGVIGLVIIVTAWEIIGLVVDKVIR